MFILLNTLWFIWMLKYVLFWLYLWQLKDYHFGRFIDHFRTHKGKKLLFNYAQIAKLVLFILFLIAGNLFSYLFLILFFVYFVQAILFLRDILRKGVKMPAWTLKTLFLTLLSFCVVILFFTWTIRLFNTTQVSAIIGFDILIPVIISVIVLFFQPFFVSLRNNVLRKAGDKIKTIKALSGLKVVAITGSYGKTSTKEFLTTILSKKYKVLSTKEHQNSEIGVAKCILEDLKPRPGRGYPEIFIAEVGAYNKGKVKEVCEMLQPKIGIVTGVNEQHMALFGSLENLLSAEGGEELADALRGDGLLIVNGDNKYCLSLYKKFSGNKKFYSLSNKIINSDVWADGVTVHRDYISFVAVDKSGEVAHFNVRVLGGQNVQNLLGAILTAKTLGMSFGEIAEACEDLKPEQAGMVLKSGKHGVDIIDSSYSSNPDGVFADLNYLKVFGGKKVIVMSCLIELGEKSAEIHEKIGRKIAEVCNLAIITSRDKFNEIEGGFNDGKKHGARILLCDKVEDIYSAVTLFCKTGDAVLLEGRVPGELIKLLTR
jgi:UDP-N-acetylmuramoyl-tripeptide--D-alanyl-D-alanine ligase